jgi:hypothetical protein
MQPTPEQLAAMRKKLVQRANAPTGLGFDKARIDPSAGNFKPSPDNLSQPADAEVIRDKKGNTIKVNWQDEKVVITKGELAQLYKEAMMKGAMAGNADNPVNPDTRKVVGDFGEFDEEAVNNERKRAEREGDLTHIQESVIARFNKKKSKFDASKYITFEQVQSDESVHTRHYA